jgi:hypothetical protein
MGDAKDLRCKIIGQIGRLKILVIIPNLIDSDRYLLTGPRCRCGSFEDIGPNQLDLVKRLVDSRTLRSMGLIELKKHEQSNPTGVL